MKFKLKLPRMTGWLLITAILLYAVYQLNPAKLGLSLYKLSLISLGGVGGYWLDRSLFPYARPHDFMCQPQSLGSPFVPKRSVEPSQQIPFASSQQRRAIIVAGAMIAVALAL